MKANEKLSRIAALVERDNESMKTYGFITHAVLDDPDIPTGCNFHTHGLQANFGHPDFQIIVAVPPEIAHSVFHNLVNEIRTGRQFRQGVPAAEILGGGFLVNFTDAVECNRPVLRVVLPDPKGNVTENTIEPPWDIQFKRFG